jgi:hypothetical protein
LVFGAVRFAVSKGKTGDPASELVGMERKELRGAFFVGFYPKDEIQPASTIEMVRRECRDGSGPKRLVLFYTLFAVATGLLGGVKM